MNLFNFKWLRKGYFKSYEHDLLIELMFRHTRGERLCRMERKILKAWLLKSPENQRLLDKFMDKDWLEEQLAQIQLPPTEEMWAEIQKHLEAVN